MLLCAPLRCKAIGMCRCMHYRIPVDNKIPDLSSENGHPQKWAPDAYIHGNNIIGIPT